MNRDINWLNSFKSGSTQNYRTDGKKLICPETFGVKLIGNLHQCKWVFGRMNHVWRDCYGAISDQDSVNLFLVWLADWQEVMSSEACTTFSLQTRMNLFCWKGAERGIMRTFKKLQQDVKRLSWVESSDQRSCGSNRFLNHIDSGMLSSLKNCWSEGVFFFVFLSVWLSGSRQV